MSSLCDVSHKANTKFLGRPWPWEFIASLFTLLDINKDISISYILYQYLSLIHPMLLNLRNSWGHVIIWVNQILSFPLFQFLCNFWLSEWGFALIEGHPASIKMRTIRSYQRKCRSSVYPLCTLTEAAKGVAGGKRFNFSILRCLST